MYCKTTNTKLLNRMSTVKDIAFESSMRMMPTPMTATTALSADRTMLSSKSLRKMVQFRDQEETQRLHCERQALWRRVCPRRAERGALARAGMARAEMRQRARAGAGDTGDTYLKQQQHDAPEDIEYYPSRRRPLLPLQREDVPPMMAKTVLDLQHSLGVDDADIRFDNFGG